MEKKNTFGLSNNRKTVKKGGFLFGGKPKEEEKAEVVEPTSKPVVPSVETVASVPIPTPAPESVNLAPEPDSKMRLPPAPSPTRKSVKEDEESLNPPIQKTQKIVGIDQSPSPATSVSLRERLRQYQDLKGTRNNSPDRPDRQKELEYLKETSPVRNSRVLDASKLDSWAGPPAQLLDSNEAPPPAAEGSIPMPPTQSPTKVPGSPSDDASEKSWVPASLRPPLNDNEEIAQHANEKIEVSASPRSPLNEDDEIAQTNEKSWLPASLRPPLNDDGETDPLNDTDSWVPRNDGGDEEETVVEEETLEETLDEEESVEEETVEEDEFSEEETAASIGSAADYEEEIFDDEEEELEVYEQNNQIDDEEEELEVYGQNDRSDDEEEVLEVYEQNEQTGEWEEAPSEGGEGEVPEEDHEILDESEAQELTKPTNEQEPVEEEEEIEFVTEERTHSEVSPMDEGGLSDEEEDGYIPLRSALTNDVDDVDDIDDVLLGESQGLFDMIDDGFPSSESSSKLSESEEEKEEDETGGWIPVPADREASVEPPPQAAPTSERSVPPVSGGAPIEESEEKAPFEEKNDGTPEQKIDYGKRYRLLIGGIIFVGILAILAILLPFLINDDDDDGKREIVVNNVSPTPGPSLRGPILVPATQAPTFVGETRAPTPAPTSTKETIAPVTSVPSVAPTSSPTTQRLGQFIQQFLIPILGEEVFQDRLSPQFLTAFFLANDDDYISQLVNREQLADRFGASLFYFSTGGDNWNSCYRNDPDCVTPGQGPWLSGDVCEWFSITCDSAGRIASINFGKFGCSVKHLPQPFGLRAFTDYPFF